MSIFVVRAQRSVWSDFSVNSIFHLSFRHVHSSGMLKRRNSLLPEEERFQRSLKSVSASCLVKYRNIWNFDWNWKSYFPEIACQFFFQICECNSNDKNKSVFQLSRTSVIPIPAKLKKNLLWNAFHKLRNCMMNNHKKQKLWASIKIEDSASKDVIFHLDTI